MQQIAAPPIQDSVVLPPEPNDPIGIWAMGQSWVNWIIRSLMKRVSQTAIVLLAVVLEDQNASVSSTPFELEPISEGTYRIAWYAEVTTAAVTSSSLTVTIGFTHNSKSLSISGAAMTGNTTTTIQTGSIVVDADQNSPLTYATTYASNGAGQMVYYLRFVIEQLN